MIYRKAKREELKRINLKYNYSGDVSSNTFVSSLGLTSAESALFFLIIYNFISYVIPLLTACYIPHFMANARNERKTLKKHVPPLPQNLLPP